MRLMIPAVMMLALPALASAQATGIQAETRGSAAVSASGASASAQGDAAAEARIEQAQARLDAEGIGDASVRSLVQLGEARGIERAEIAAAVEQRADALIEARDALHAAGAAHTTTNIELAAHALESGAAASHVVRVLGAFDGAAHASALEALGVVAARGPIGTDVVASVRSALDAGVGIAAPSIGGQATGGAAAAAGATGVIGSTGVSAAGSAAGAVTGSLPR